MLQEYGVQLDNTKCKKSSDASLAYGLRFSTTSSHLQWTPAGSTDRLPGGGGATSGCPSSCHRSCANEDEDSLITACDLPAPSRVKRPVCVVFDELDPISALERSFEMSAQSQSQFQSHSTQTIFVEHKSTQTEISNRYNKVRDVSTQVEESDFQLTHKPLKKKKSKKHEAIEETPSYYISNRRRTKGFTAPLAPNQSNVLQKMHFWRRNFSEDKQIETEFQANVEKEQEQEENRKSCPNCQNVPDISRKLSELMLKLDRQEAQVRQLENALNSMKMQQEIRHLNPPLQAAPGVIRMRDDSTITDQSEISNSYPASYAPQGIIRIRDAGTLTDPSFKFTSTKTRMRPKEEVNVFLGNRSSKVEFAVQSTPNSLLHSSECQMCSEKLQPVLDDLIEEVLRLMGHREFSDIMLTVLLWADNVYRVNVQERQSKRNLGCILVTNAAIEAAVNSGFFNQILTYSATDVRNSIKSTSSRPFGIPFEFVSTEETALNATNDEEDCKQNNFRVGEFLTKVLRMPANNFSQG